MRLLNTQTLDLEEVDFKVAKKKGYAILSHTWGEDEISFQKYLRECAPQSEHRNERSLSGSGYSKIVSTCRKAREDGHKYAWVDTCCINKESSAELSEAINSMWNWYRRATICYVHLSDYPDHLPSLSDRNNPALPDNDMPTGLVVRQQLEHGHDVLRSSRWFTRSWTLQELLAPKQIQIFGSAWNLVGTKDSLRMTLARITRIDARALQADQPVSTFVVAKRMSWAAGRQATREEDRAYSLLGIFGINIPLIYGEGRRAFLRLQEEIVRRSTDHSIFAFDYDLDVEGSGNPSYEPGELFARSPDQFRDGCRVRPCRYDLMDAPYQLTNRGLEFDSMRVYQDHGVWTMLLNCRFEDDLRGPLGIRMKSTMESTMTSMISFEQKPRPNDFWLEPLSPYISIGNFRSRLSVVKISTEDAEPRPVSLLKGWSSAGLSHLSYIQDIDGRTVQLRLLTTHDNILRYELHDVFPKDCWNISTGTIHFDYINYASQKKLTASATLSCGGSHIHVAFDALDSSAAPGEAYKVYGHHLVKFVITNTTRESAVAQVSKTASALRPQLAVTVGNVPMIATASITFGYSMGTRIRVIKIKLEPVDSDKIENVNEKVVKAKIPEKRHYG